VTKVLLAPPTRRGAGPRVSDAGDAAPVPDLRPDVPGLVDRHGRVATDLRVSLTDRCNLRCTYCMPAEGRRWLAPKHVLTDDEIIRLVTIAVLAGLAAADAAGLRPIKINTVLMRGVNDHEAVPLLTWALEHAYELRFIEQMPLGPADAWHLADMVTADEILASLRTAFTLTDPAPASRGAAPAQTWLVGAAGSGAAGSLRRTVGIVASVTRPFCGGCDRVRTTADGRPRDCPFARGETDLIGRLRSGVTDGELAEVWRRAMWEKLPRHRIALPGFVQPDRPMSAIGG